MKKTTSMLDAALLAAEPAPGQVQSVQVISRTSGRLGPQDLGSKDTALSCRGETVTLAIRFEQYAGLYVLHCHDLEHEDAGMMLNLDGPERGRRAGYEGMR